ncbi:hypothetical protein [Bacteriovorax sp. Seq25_V]|nr:hypothetical protein [Bacteriovorax sp. Seq25_V]EQC47347.1 hypothetical protein M900_0610 [Bacteriovorax sp. Seq25_V]
MNEQQDVENNSKSEDKGSNLSLYIIAFLFVTTFIGVIIDGFIRK